MTDESQQSQALADPASKETRSKLTFAAVILAAGASSRMGTPKALLNAGAGECFLDQLAGTFLRAGCTVYVVLGAQAAEVEAGIRRGGEVQFVVNPDPSRGQLSSLQCGLRSVALSAESIFFSPVDAPGIAGETLQVLKDMLVGMDFAIPIYEGKRGHPVLMKASAAAQFLEAPLDASARDILHARRAVTRYVEVADAAILDDIDDPRDYERWRSAVAGSSGTGSR